MKTLVAFVLALLSLSAAIDAETTVLASGMEPPEGAFWLTTELINLSFTPGCMTTKFCVKPAFKITQSMNLVPESPAMSWPINENLTKDGRDHTFVTFWTSGEPKLVSFVAEIIGKDPAFGFPRVCDQTPETKVFQPDNAYFRSAFRARRHLGSEHRKPAQVADSPIELTLVGSCFNATFAIRRHLERCPWCPDRNLHVSLSSNENADEANWDNSVATLMNDDRVFYCFVITSIVLFIITVAVIVCVCTYAPCCQRRIRRNKTQKQLNMNMYHQRALPPNHYNPRQQTMELLKNQALADEDEHHYQMPMLVSDAPEHRYETPWDRKYRPIQPYWNTSSASHKSELTVTSPVESSSALGSMSDRTGPCHSGSSIAGVNHYGSGSMLVNGMTHGVINADGTVRLPMNMNSTSPMSAHSISRHDDSGLESV
uniref:CUB domain-containing protein n=1 Tax=Panagrellus redivivus TaxID=6233 RepID=A0A7E4ZSK5_PANRE